MKNIALSWRNTIPKRFLQVAAGELLLVLLDLLCYGDRIWLLPLQLLLIPFIREWDKYRERSLKGKYSRGFRNLLQSLMISVQAGYTIENALRAALPELEKNSGGRKDPTVPELRRIVHGMDLGIPVEELFKIYARRTGSEDIMHFAGVLEIVKNTGGNLVLVLKKTIRNFQIKMDTQKEIKVILSGVVYEKNIMLMMPLMVFAYMRVTDHEYMSCLYETVPGHILTSLVLAGTAVCYYWTESMIRINF
ncbi:MAG: type II secretion system F family protein [Eubacterium sp.]|nr:type II secretion system F family protein [Eubacterium sp.]